MANPDDGGYIPHRFQVYVDGKPIGRVWGDNQKAVAFAKSLTIGTDDCIEIVALGPDEDPTSVVTGYGRHNG